MPWGKNSSRPGAFLLILRQETVLCHSKCQFVLQKFQASLAQVFSLPTGTGLLQAESGQLGGTAGDLFDAFAGCLLPSFTPGWLASFWLFPGMEQGVVALMRG